MLNTKSIFKSLFDEYWQLVRLIEQLHQNSTGSYKRSISNQLWDIRWQHHDMHVKKMERFCNRIKKLVLGMRSKDFIHFLHDQILNSIDSIMLGLEEVVEIYRVHSGVDVSLRTLDVEIYLSMEGN